MHLGITNEDFEGETKLISYVKERCLTPDESKRLIKELETVDLKYKIIVHLAIMLGLRRSEILGIKWSDIDFDKCTVSICQSSLQVCNVVYVEGYLKNTYSHRKIYMPKTTMELLKDYRKESLKYNKDIISTLNLKPNQTFLVNKYKMQSKYFKTEELETILQELINLDYNYKIGNIDINIGLESILCRYCS